MDYLTNLCTARAEMRYTSTTGTTSIWVWTNMNWSGSSHFVEMSLRRGVDISLWSTCPNLSPFDSIPSWIVDRYFMIFWVVLTFFPTFFAECFTALCRGLGSMQLCWQLWDASTQGLLPHFWPILSRRLIDWSDWSMMHVPMLQCCTATWTWCWMLNETMGKEGIVLGAVRKRALKGRTE